MSVRQGLEIDQIFIFFQNCHIWGNVSYKFQVRLRARHQLAINTYLQNQDGDDDERHV